MLVGTDQLRFRQNVFVHRIQQLLFRRPGLQLRHPVQSIQFEKVAVCQTTRRAGADVPDFSKIINALFRTIRERLLVWNPLPKRMAGCWQIVEHPMHPYSGRRIRIMDDQSKALRIPRCISPTQRDRDIGTVAGVLGRNGQVLLESRTPQFERHDRLPLLRENLSFRYA